MTKPTLDEAEYLKHASRIASTYRHRSDPSNVAYTFSAGTLAEFVGEVEKAVLAKPTEPPKMVTPYITQEHFDSAFPDTPLCEFKEGQWWVQELDAMAKGATPDQRRAVAVVHNLLRTIN